MPIEPSVNWFSDYDINQPQDGDDLVEGDNHIRNLKKSILAQFPTLGDVAMNCTAAELNALAGSGIVSTDVDKLVAFTFSAAEANAIITGKTLASADDVIDNFPAGTLMTFQQTAAPTGWTKAVTHNDKALRVVSGTASNGGTNAFSAALNASKNVSGTGLTAAQNGPHSHGVGTLSVASGGSHSHDIRSSNGAGGSASPVTTRPTGVVQNLTDSTEAAGSHSHSLSGSTASNGSGATHNHNFNLDVQYVDLILAAKD